MNTRWWTRMKAWLRGFAALLCAAVLAGCGAVLADPPAGPASPAGPVAGGCPSPQLAADLPAGSWTEVLAASAHTTANFQVDGILFQDLLECAAPGARFALFGIAAVDLSQAMVWDGVKPQPGANTLFSTQAAFVHAGMAGYSTLGGIQSTADGTAVLGSLQYAGQDLALAPSGATPNVWVLFDGYLQDPSCDMFTYGVNPQHCLGAITAALRDAGELADLRGARVWIGGIDAGNDPTHQTADAQVAESCALWKEVVGIENGRWAGWCAPALPGVALAPAAPGNAN